MLVLKSGRGKGGDYRPVRRCAAAWCCPGLQDGCYHFISTLTVQFQTEVVPDNGFNPRWEKDNEFVFRVTVPGATVSACTHIRTRHSPRAGQRPRRDDQGRLHRTVCSASHVAAARCQCLWRCCLTCRVPQLPPPLPRRHPNPICLGVRKDLHRLEIFAFVLFLF